MMKQKRDESHIQSDLKATPICRANDRHQAQPYDESLRSGSSLILRPDPRRAV